MGVEVGVSSECIGACELSDGEQKLKRAIGQYQKEEKKKKKKKGKKRKENGEKSEKM